MTVKTQPRASKTVRPLEGMQIYLRKIVLFDVNDRYLQWMHDPEVIKYLEVRHSRRNLKDLREYAAGVIERKEDLFFAICLNENGKHIGNIKLGPINRVHGFAHIGFIIGDREYWGKGIATEAVNLLVDYAFGNLGLHKVLGGCYENNEGSKRVFKKCGFKKEGIEESQWLYDGKYINGIIFAKLNPSGKK